MIVSIRREYGQFITSGAQLLLLAIGAELETRGAWLTCVALMSLVSLIAWVSTLQRRRTVADTPTSRIASAAQGYVELSGQGKPLDYPPLLSHLTSLPCLWYRYRVEEKSGNDEWKTVSSGESEVSFILDDGSGRCVVDVENAEILTRHKETWTNGRYRNTEWKLLIDDGVYALGEFITLGGSRLELNAHRDINSLLAEWKKDQPSLLRRFDLDGDGSISMTEWALARQAARREVEKSHREVRNEADVHTLRCPTNGQLYLLSNIGPDKISRRYLWWSLFHLSVFFGSLAALSWIWQQHF
ncbi:MAG: hypothetical protein IPN64_02465 [Propionivibrio sp.]|uniref:hypothetical protein n=1 Tax=Propionivibrio sp. TaxID=2212460 RepID=UPI0025F3E9B7|nr:hypothetical protein [Propionivibrio sp.]MBK7355983.1 hypothetical protein [Propionivibrio sp.]MBK8892944.1 hypothetical protein [Propionivibrio sp.]